MSSQIRHVDSFITWWACYFLTLKINWVTTKNIVWWNLLVVVSEYDNFKFPTSKRFTVVSRVWVTTATLHKENPTRSSFTVDEIRQKVHKQGFSTHAKKTIDIHIMAHCVANAPLNQCTSHRKLCRVGKSLYRLYRNGDPCDEAKLNGKTHLPPETLPPEYKELVE